MATANTIGLYPNKSFREPQYIEFDQFILAVKAGKWKDVCELVMEQPDKARRDDLKKDLPCVTGSGMFNEKGKSAENLIQHSGLIFMDFDHAAAPDALREDPYTLALFSSVSRTGFVVVVKIDPTKHADAFEGLSKYYFEKYGLVADQSCKNVNRLRFVTYDPELFHNSAAKLFKDYPKAEDKRTTHLRTKVNYVHTKDKFTKVLNQITFDITADYHTWLKLGFAIGSEYGAAGEEYFHQLSQYSPKYNREVCSRQYRQCLKPGNISIGTFYYYAQLAGVTVIEDLEKRVALSVYYAKKAGRGLGDVPEILRQQKLPALPEVVDQVWNTNTPPPLSHDQAENVAAWICANYRIRQNSITHRHEQDGKALGERDLNTIYLRARGEFQDLSSDLFWKIICSGFVREYNPLREYLDGLLYDGVSRVADLARVINSDTGTEAYREQVVRSWLLGMVETVYTGQPNIIQLILAGLQNTGKSHFFKNLLPEPLRPYVAFSQLDRGKDDEMLMCEMLLIINDEYGGQTRTDAIKQKRLISAPYFSLRAPYARVNERYERLATLGATTNETDILNDATGNRRNMVLNVIGQFDYELFNSIDKAQLFAELVARHRAGETSTMTREFLKQVEEYTAAPHAELSAEAEALHKFFYPQGKETEVEFMTTTDIKDYIETATRQRLSLKKLGSELKRLEYKRLKSGSWARGYYVQKKPFVQ